MSWLKRIIEKNDSQFGRIFDVVVQLLILVSLVTFSLETLPDLSARQVWWLRMIEIVTVTLFTIEYLLRVFVADRKTSFIFSFYGVVDLLSILPFYISTGVDLRSIRAFRFFRLFRAFKLVRYSRAIQRFHRALLIAREELVLYILVTLMLFYFAAVGIYYFENPAQPNKFSSIFDSLWWSIVTLTTVGYGDAYPITIGGRIFTFVLLLVGLGVISVPSGIVSSALSKARELESEANNQIPSEESVR
jgi:voltage-gated potassium channel